MSNPITKLGASGILQVDGKILLGLRAKDDPSLPGLWCTPGGGVEFQEMLDDTIVREFKEEAGIYVAVSHQFTHITENVRPGKHTIIVFRRVILNAGSPSALDGFDDIAWFDFGQVESMARENQITPATVTALRAYFAWQMRNS